MLNDLKTDYSFPISSRKRDLVPIKDPKVVCKLGIPAANLIDAHLARVEASYFARFRLKHGHSVAAVAPPIEYRTPAAQCRCMFVCLQMHQMKYIVLYGCKVGCY